MAKYVVGLILAGWFAFTAAEKFPKERGVIMTAYQYNNKNGFKLVHLPIYPGYEQYDGKVHGVGFANRDTHFMSVDVDYATKSIYMYDYHMRAIVMGSGYSKDFNKTGMELHYVHVGVSRGIVQVAVDWLSHTIYWTDAVFKWIIAAPGEADKIEMEYYKIIADDHLDAPNGVTLDPFDGYLFWTDTGRHPKIERSDLMGGNRETIISSARGVLLSPLSIETDIFEKRIYWLDAMAESVMTATYDGKDIQMIQRLPHARLMDLAIFRDCVILTDIASSSMYTLNKTLGPDKGKSELTPISFRPKTLHGIAVYSQETQPLNQTDVCAMKNCEHMCISTKTGATCVCSDGYTMNSTGMCSDIGMYHRALVFANATHICFVDIRSFAHFSFEPFCIFTVIQQSLSTRAASVAPGELITMFDMNMDNRILYFANADNIIYEREIDIRITNDVKTELVRATGTISGLAYDAGDSNSLYWCESDTGVVHLINLVSRSPIIVSHGLTNPRNIIVLVKTRKLAWIAGNAGYMSIQTMNMNGRNITTVIDNVADIVSLVVNEVAQLFYFLSNGKIYSTTLIGSYQKTVPSEIDHSAYKFLHYNSYIAWISSSKGQPNMMKTQYLKNRNVNGHGSFDNVSTIVDFKVLDVKLQSSDIHSPCAFENGGCSHICITQYTNDVMTKVCECKLGFTLDADLQSCKTATISDNFIIVADRTNRELQQIDLVGNEVHAIDSSDSGSYAGVYFDAKSKKIIWSEFLNGGIFSAYVNGSDHQTLAELGNAYAYRFDMDTTTGNLYYTANKISQIGMLTPSGMNMRLNTNFAMDHLGDIIVHPRKGWLFFTAYSYPSYIARADMDGKNVVKLIQGDHVLYPIGLAIDFTRDKLYWSDGKLDTIQRCDLDALECTTIVNMAGINRTEQIRDLVIDGEFLYYSAYKNDHVVSVNLQEPYERSRVGQNTGLGKLDTMTLFKSTNKNIQSAVPAIVAKTQSSSWISDGAVVTSIVLLLCVIIALVSALLVFVYRNMTKSSYTNRGIASYSARGRNVAMRIPTQRTPSMKNTYVEKASYMTQIPPPMSSVSESDLGIVNSTGEELLQQETGDKTVLTYDSWLKEKVKAARKI